MKKIGGHDPEPTLPVRHWRNYDRSLKTGDVGDRARQEAARDLEKEVPQLLCDIHDGHQRWIAVQKKKDSDYKSEQDPTQLELYVAARAASMNAQVAIQSQKLARWTFGLTVASALIALFALVVAVVALWGGS